MKAARKKKIVDAAERLFAENGFRATSMEGIATAADMAKATVYSYFKNKDALFVAAARRFADQLAAAVEEAMDGEDTLADSISAGLVARYKLCHSVLQSSTFSFELFGAGHKVVGELTVEMTANVEATLCRAMRQAGYPLGRARALARLLTASTEGISHYTRDYKHAITDIRTLVACVVR